MTMSPEIDLEHPLLSAVLRQHQIEQFYYHEATLLDTHRYEDWVNLFSDDTHYFMPIRRTRLRRELTQEFTKPGEMSFYDDDKAMLLARWKKFASNASWAEDPPSRTRHLVMNVQVVEDRGDELEVDSNFHLYRSRLKSEEDAWIGSRKDVLRREGDSFLIAKRVIFLEQTILLARNLSTLF